MVVLHSPTVQPGQAQLGKKRSYRNPSVSWKLHCCILDTPTLLVSWLLFKLINLPTFRSVFFFFIFLEWAQSWPFNPTGPGPEPCWTPNQTFGFCFNDLRFPSKTELVFLYLSLPTMTFILKKKFDKLCDVKSQNSIYNNTIAKTFCTTILVLLPWATWFTWFKHRSGARYKFK